MSGIRSFLEEVLKLRINADKSAVARPWKRKFLGYSVTRTARVGCGSRRRACRRLTQKVRELMRQGRGRTLTRTIETLNPCCGAG